ncbi:MAG: hypothetical protein JO010_10175 [Alphaproteobacteria bacterium]|nr:hypothetical protein [Alphaproteobacteria bacterium]
MSSMVAESWEQPSRFAERAQRYGILALLIVAFAAAVLGLCFPLADDDWRAGEAAAPPPIVAKAP